MSARTIAIVGDEATVTGFRPLGFAVFPLAVPAAARQLWPELTSGHYAVVLITEAVYEQIAELVSARSEQPLPAITIIPGAGSAGGAGEARISAAIERALGAAVTIGAEDR
ncbi:MAG: V-type ATP synthase subunit F [Clostridiales bacterium]|nr:V-type ATP synthase subunit F [Clostridiales bacterium]